MPMPMPMPTPLGLEVSQPPARSTEHQLALWRPTPKAPAAAEEARCDTPSLASSTSRALALVARAGSAAAVQLRVAESLPAVLRHQISSQISHQISRQMICPTDTTDDTAAAPRAEAEASSAWEAIWEVEITDLEEELATEGSGSSVTPAPLRLIAPPPAAARYEMPT